MFVCQYGKPLITSVGTPVLSEHTLHLALYALKEDMLLDGRALENEHGSHSLGYNQLLDFRLCQKAEQPLELKSPYDWRMEVVTINCLCLCPTKNPRPCHPMSDTDALNLAMRAVHYLFFF